MSNQIASHIFSLALFLSGSVGAAVDEVRPSSELAQVSFKHSDDHLGRTLLLALGFVTLVAAGAFTVVRLQKNGKLGPLSSTGKKFEGCRVLEYKRINGKLVVLTLELSSGAMVTIADNGSAITVLDRIEPNLGTTRSNEADHVG